MEEDHEDEDNDKRLDDEWASAEVVLGRLKHSCFAMHLLYRRRYIDSRRRLSFYDVPIIVFSAINSVIIAGGKDFIPADALQIMTCLLAVAVGIIQAIKNYFKIDESRESCLSTYKDLFSLFCEISLLLDQPREVREVEPRRYVADKGVEYRDIMDKSIILEDNRTKRNPIYEDNNPYVAGSSGLSSLYHDTPDKSEGSEPDTFMSRQMSLKPIVTSVSTPNLPKYEPPSPVEEDQTQQLETIVEVSEPSEVEDSSTQTAEELLIRPVDQDSSDSDNE